MKKNTLIVVMIAVVTVGLFLFLSSNASAGSSKKDVETQEQAQAQTTTGTQDETVKSGQPLYFEPDKAKGKGTDDSAPYSDPWYGKEDKYKSGHGSQPGPKGKVEDVPEKKVIEGPVRYERVD